MLYEKINIYTNNKIIKESIIFLMLSKRPLFYSLFLFKYKTLIVRDPKIDDINFF